MPRDLILPSRRTPAFYVGVRTFTDPTPRTALEHLEPAPEKPEKINDPRQAIVLLSNQMRALKEKRQRREITRSEFREQHGELSIVYRAIVNAHIETKNKGLDKHK